MTKKKRGAWALEEAANKEAALELLADLEAEGYHPMTVTKEGRTWIVSARLAAALCEVCEKPMPPGVLRKYCSHACRQRAYRGRKT